MFIAIDRNNGIFDKETSDQLNVRINNLTNSTKNLASGRTREHYYDNCNYINIEFNNSVQVIRDSSFEYGKVLILDFNFKIVGSDRTIGKISNYEMPYDVYLTACDGDANSTTVVVLKNGEIKFAALPNLYGECGLYGVIIKTA